MENDFSKVDYSSVTIGQWADYFRYDPDGLDGKPPSPRNLAFEDAFFGKGIMRIIREKQKEQDGRD